MTESLTVHLVRHGETQTYDEDAGLTALGRTQAAERGTALAARCRAGDRVAFRHPMTRRAQETAELARTALLEEAARRGIELVDAGIAADPGFRNVQVWTEDGPREPTQVRRHVIGRSAEGPEAPPGWVIEAARFWQAHETGDAMAFWLMTPLLWHEPPASVVQRMLATSARNLASGVTGQLVVGTHSGCLRAVVWWAAGEDLGEPDNGAEVIVRVRADTDLVEVAYAGRSWWGRVPPGPLDWSAPLVG